MNTPPNQDDIARERMLAKCETARDVEVADAVIAQAERACRPILFTGEMVRAILDGRKTQTRRVVRDLTDDDGFTSPTDCYFYAPSKIDRNGMLYPGEEVYGIAHEDAGWVCPYGPPGDLLWVRETWTCKMDSGTFVYRSDGHHECLYRATEQFNISKDDGDGGTEYRKDGTEASPWRPSILMPRWASRITLEIVSVRVQKVHQISYKDVLAEGITEHQIDHWRKWLHKDDAPAHTYGVLWDSINGKKHPWSSNPWVWVITFRRIHP